MPGWAAARLPVAQTQGRVWRHDTHLHTSAHKQPPPPHTHLRRAFSCSDAFLILTYPDGSNYTLTQDMGGIMDYQGNSVNCLANTTFLSSACADVGSVRVITADSEPPYTGTMTSALSVTRSPGTGAAGTYMLTVIDDRVLSDTRLVSVRLKFFALP
jgi:hypothetical protein